jgi:hypothetical protein
MGDECLVRAKMRLSETGSIAIVQTLAVEWQCLFEIVLTVNTLCRPLLLGLKVILLHRTSCWSSTVQQLSA